MAKKTKEQINELIDSKIYENRRREVTATNLNGVLKEIVDTSYNESDEDLSYLEIDELLNL